MNKKEKLKSNDKKAEPNNGILDVDFTWNDSKGDEKAKGITHPEILPGLYRGKIYINAVMAK